MVKIFEREKGLAALRFLGITFLLALGFVVIMSFASGTDYAEIGSNFSHQYFVTIVWVLGVVTLSSALLAPLNYLWGKKKMLKHLENAMWSICKWIPFIRKKNPAYISFKEYWETRSKLDERYEREASGTHNSFHMDNEEYMNRVKYSVHRMLFFAFAFICYLCLHYLPNPISLAWNLLKAFSIPIVSEIATLLVILFAFIVMSKNANAPLLVTIGVICFALVVLAYVVYPVICLCRNPKDNEY